ncbi:MAG TPA: metal-dependent transcriptional regulator [Candidatus Ornithospirochaeta stercorigallinarum]|nr:metal-dependent transcriptional regulator [Candidatus Ornithospirochaeta stercorigallinarum]
MDAKESSEDYLEAILIISNEKKVVRNIDIARHLEFSKPSVSIALKKLKEKGLIEIDGDNLVTLTKEGLEIAEKTYQKHLGITRVLISLGVDKKTAEKDACRIEHVISEETFNAISEHAQKMLTKVKKEG